MMPLSVKAKIKMKKAYYYSMDALVAILIITIGIFIILQSGQGQQPNQTIYSFSDDLTNYLTHTKVYDLNDELNPDTIRLWKQNGVIKYPSNSLLEQAGEFYARGELSTARLFLSNVTLSAVPPIYSAEILVDGVQLFNKTIIPEGKSKSLVSSRVLIVGLLNSRASWGPYVAEIKVWQ